MMRVVRFSKRQKIVILGLVLLALFILSKIYADFQTQPQYVQMEDTSLSFSDGSFYLDGEKIQIFSGSLHYFRVVPDYWLDRLEKMRAAGLNTIDTYVTKLVTSRVV